MLLPLVPSVHPSAFFAEGIVRERQASCNSVLQRDRHTCRFCGLPAGSWRDVFHLNDDHEDWSDSNLAASCPICHGVQHVGDPTANQTMRVVWLPELTQSLLNVTVRGIHRILHAEGVSPTLGKRPIIETADLKCAWRAYTAFDVRAASACSVIDTDKPRDLAGALRALSPADYARRNTLLGGLRLLHRGRSLFDGEDTYPAQLDTWFPPEAGTAAALPPSPPPTSPLRSAACSAPS